MKKADLDAVKHFITKTEDNYRGAFKKRTSSNPRQCILIGTSNTYDFLKDPTGDRRFYPLDVGVIKNAKNAFKDFKRNEVDNIWAEAYQLYIQGEESYIADEHLLEMAKAEQKAHREEHPYQGLIEEYLNIPITENWKDRDLSKRIKYLRDYMDNDPNLIKGTVKRDRVCIMEIWRECLGGQPKDLKRAESLDIKKCVLKLDEWEWHKNPLSFGSIYGRQKGFVKVDKRQKSNQKWE